MQEKNLIFDVPYVIIGSEIQTSVTTETSPIGVFFTQKVQSGGREYPISAGLRYGRLNLPAPTLQVGNLFKRGNEMEKLLQPVTVTVKNGRTITTSQNVSLVFGKKHADVLRAINNLQESIPAEFSQRNFASAKYQDGQDKSRPMYELTRDGFTLLAMGFTGKRALEFKLAYINAFNEMERKLAEPKTITVKSHTRKLPSKAAQPKSKVWDVEACGIPVSEQMPVAGALWDFMHNARSVAELDKRRDYMMRGIINMHAHNSMRLQGLPGLIKEVR